MSSLFYQRSKKRVKTSRVAPLIMAHHHGKPVWTPRHYEALAAEGYQKNVIVYRCVNIIARAVASVPWLLYERDENGNDHEIYTHPLLSLMQQPSPIQAGASFMEDVVSFLLLSGNSYVEAVYNDIGAPIELYALRPDRMAVVPSESGDITGYEYRVNGKVKRVEVEDGHASPILHLKLFHPLHDYYGLSPLEAAASSIDQHNAVGQHNFSLLQHGGRPTGALMVKQQNLTHEQREELRSDLRGLYQGEENAGKIMILEGDFEWKEMGLSPKDLDFIEGKNISAREIAQAFGVPSILVGIMGDATYANYKEARLHLWEDTVLPLLEAITTEVNAWLSPFFGRNLRLSYDTDAIPALSTKREAHWDKIAEAVFLTINEKRQAIGYPPIEGGDRIK